jgi:hypothetical protein
MLEGQLAAADLVMSLVGGCARRRTSKAPSLELLSFSR